jgi:hypothetical protein
MSGLYGLIDAAEWIQEYDIHLTDRILGQGVPVSALWRELFTDSLAEYIRLAHKAKKVQIINCLCDDFYVDAIDWHKLPPECSVYHLASPDHHHTDLLPAAGTVINCLLRQPEKIDQIERSTRERLRLYPLSDFGRPPENHAGTRIAFEARIGDLRDRAETAAAG